MGLRLPGTDPQDAGHRRRFRQPIRQVFETFFRIERHLPSPVRRKAELLRQGGRPLLVLALRADHPVGRFPGRVVGKIQQGRISVYLTYSFFTLLVLLLSCDERYRTSVSVAATCHRAGAGAAPRRLGQPVPRLAAEQVGASLLLPYRTIRKLFLKDAVVASNASPLFRLMPYIVFGAMCCAAAIVPSLATDLPFAYAADAIALVGLFALARVFIALAAMDIGTSFGTMGARREMFVGFLAEPALLMVFFTRR
jgi:hypothetical protein